MTYRLLHPPCGEKVTRPPWCGKEAVMLGVELVGPQVVAGTTVRRTGMAGHDSMHSGQTSGNLRAERDRNTDRDREGDRDRDGDRNRESERQKDQKL